MSVLYPRLLDRPARDLHGRYKSLSVAELEKHAASRHPAAVFAATGGRRASAEELDQLRELVLGAARRAGFPAEGRRQDRVTFDVEVAKLLHDRSGMVAAEASVRATWAFIALVLVPDVAYWRFPQPPADRMIGTDITRHVVGRLWWRAHLLEDPGGADRYGLLDAFGEAAFDQIFARRSSLGGSRGLVRALARVWQRRELAGINERDVLRDVLKRLLRLGSVLEFEALDDDGLESLVSEVLAETIAARRTAGEGTRGNRHVLTG